MLTAFLPHLGTYAHAQAYDSTEYDWQHNPGASKEEVCGAYAIKQVVLAAINTNYKCGQTGGYWSDPLSVYQYCMSTDMNYAKALSGPDVDNIVKQDCTAARF